MVHFILSRSSEPRPKPKEQHLYIPIAISTISVKNRILKTNETHKTRSKRDVYLMFHQRTLEVRTCTLKSTALSGFRKVWYTNHLLEHRTILHQICKGGHYCTVKLFRRKNVSHQPKFWRHRLHDRGICQLGTAGTLITASSRGLRLVCIILEKDAPENHEEQKYNVARKPCFTYYRYTTSRNDVL